MRPLLRLLNGIRALSRRAAVDEELDAELQEFLETAVDEKMQRGMSREQATRAARLELGLVSVESVKDRVRDVGWETQMESIWLDVRYALRGLRRAPGFTAAAVLTLAIGTGANVGIFSIIDHAMFRPLPVPAPEQLVNLLSPGPKAGSTSGNSNLGPTSAIFSYPLFRDLQRIQTIFTDVAAQRDFQANVSFGGQASHEPGWLESGSYFTVLGIPPAVGRLLTLDDDRVPGAHHVVIAMGQRILADPLQRRAHDCESNARRQWTSGSSRSSVSRLKTLSERHSTTRREFSCRSAWPR